MPSTGSLSTQVPFADDFTTRDVETNGATLHTRIGGSGPGRAAAARLRRDGRFLGAVSR